MFATFVIALSPHTNGEAFDHQEHWHEHHGVSGLLLTLTWLLQALRRPEQNVTCAGCPNIVPMHCSAFICRGHCFEFNFRQFIATVACDLCVLFDPSSKRSEVTPTLSPQPLTAVSLAADPSSVGNHPACSRACKRNRKRNPASNVRMLGKHLYGRGGCSS